MDSPLNGKDWIIRFEPDGRLELTLRAYRNPSASHMKRRGRALLREQGLNEKYELVGDVLSSTEWFLGTGMCESRSMFAVRKLTAAQKALAAKAARAKKKAAALAAAAEAAAQPES
jgi:hypothetical protein